MDIKAVQATINTLCDEFRIPKGVYRIQQEKGKNNICVYGDTNRRVFLLRDSEFQPSFLSKMLDAVLRNMLQQDLWENNIQTDDYSGYYMEVIRSLIDEKIRQLIGVRFEDLVRLNGMTYEGESLKAKIVIVLDNLDSISEGLEFDIKDSISLEPKYFSTIRKFLAGCGKRALLFCYDGKEENKYKLFMRGYIDRQLIKALNRKTRIITIVFYGKQEWIFGDNSARPMFVENLKIYHTRVTAEMVCKELITKLGDGINYLPIIRTLMEQQHGTSIIFYKGRIIDNYINSSLYNLKRAVRIKTSMDPTGIIMKDSNLLAISRIDGAFAVNIEEKTITTFGAIVEGCDCAIGDIGHGARYNTLKDFVESYSDGVDNLAVAVVISSDGTVNILSK